MSLTFDAPSHTYRTSGAAVPSVTQLLGKLHSFAGVPLDVLEAARERGTAVHLACEFFDENDLDEAALDERTAGYLAGWKKFRSESRVEFTEIEQMAVHPLYRYAGKWDRGGLIDGIDWTIDIKTAAASHWCWGLQTAGYAALRGKPHSKRGTVQLRPDGTYRFKEWPDADDYPAFVSLVTLHNKAQRHAND